MKIGRGIEIRKVKTGEIVFNYKQISLSSVNNADCTEELSILYRLMTQTAEEKRETVLTKALLDRTVYPIIGNLLQDAGIKLEEKIADVHRGIENLMKFFTEFQFEPNFRFVNTLARNLQTDTKTAKSYVNSYFELIDSPYAKEVAARVKSEEFDNILFDLKAAQLTKQVNNRFKLYYGSQGTGKTYTAQKESGGRCVVCNSSMLPSDLMEDFKFVDGKATFDPSILWECMEKGETIVLDEINLLPFDSLRFLQGILDGKTEFTYKNKEVHIKDGFKVIGTMNLSINGMTYGLPEPLVDRCEEMKNFKLTVNDLLGAF